MLYEKLPTKYDARVKTIEADVHKDKFENIGYINQNRQPKGVLMHGSLGTGKTMMTRATFLTLAGPQLIQMFIRDSAKMVRDAYQLAQEKAPAIIFIDELDFIETKKMLVPKMVIDVYKENLISKSQADFNFLNGTRFFRNNRQNSFSQAKNLKYMHIKQVISSVQAKKKQFKLLCLNFILIYFEIFIIN